MRRLRALDITEERRLGGTLAGLMYLTGAATLTLLLLLPGIDKGHRLSVLGLAGLGLVLGLLALFVIDWDRAPALVSHLSTALGLPITAAGVALTGGAGSPARFYAFFIVIYASYFYPRRQAVAYVVAAVGLIALPLAYDPDAIELAAWGELLVLAPTFGLLGGLIMAGKQLLVELSRHDPLTGLVNRRAFRSHLERHLAGQRADQLGLMLADLDAFKCVNTTYGHPAGDEVLRSAALALRKAVRADDMVVRLGGDEFAVVVLKTNEQGMRALAGRVRAELLQADGRLELPEFRLSASVGWALWPRDGEGADELVAVADRTLRGAKGTGKDRSVSPLDRLPEPASAPAS